jgi:hypothetical protein
LKAEFPHLWPYIEKFHGHKAEYSADALKSLLGQRWEKKCKDLISIGVLKKSERHRKIIYTIPYVYRGSLEIVQGRV